MSTNHTAFSLTVTVCTQQKWNSSPGSKRGTTSPMQHIILFPTGLKNKPTHRQNFQATHGHKHDC